MCPPLVFPNRSNMPAPLFKEVGVAHNPQLEVKFKLSIQLPWPLLDLHLECQ
jgi:hypothetical protein